MSYTLAYTGTQIDDILGRSAPNGEFDGYFADINDKLDKLNIVTTSDDYATVQAYVQNNVAVALSDGGKFYVYTGEYDGNYYFACVTQGSSDTTDAVFEVAYIDSGNNWSVGGWSALAPVFSPNFTGNPTAPTPTQSSNNTKIATTAFVHNAVDPVSSAALNAYPTDSVSGDVVSFPDGADGIPVKAFTGSIIPQQNLNGQSAPYPAGGGKNKLQITATTQTINGVTITVNADGSIKVNGTTTAQTILPISGLLTPLVTGNPVILNGCPSGGSVSTYCLDTGFNAYVDSGNGVTLGDAQLSGQRVRLRLANGQTFNNMMFYPMIRLATETDATFAPYANICPISGWAGASLFRMGANLCNPATITDGYRVSNNGNLIVGATAAVTDYISIKGNTSYYLRNTLGASSFYSGAVYDANKTFIQNVSVLGSGASSGAITTPANARFIRVNMPLASKADFAVNYPSTDHDYHAYSGQTITLPFGANIWNEQWELGSIDNSGNFTGGSSTFRVKSKIPVTGGKEYVLVYGSISAPTRTLWGFWYDNSETLIGTRFEITNSPTTLKAPANAKYFAFRTGGNAPATSYLGDIAIMDVIVYAGTITALGGGLWKIQPTHAYRELTGTESFSTYSSVPNSVSLALTGVTPNIKASADIISDRYKHQSISAGDGINVGSSALYIRDTVNCANATGYKAYLAAQLAAGTPVQICYELATLPDPITITGEDLQTLLGANTVWTDCGSVTGMTYRADTTLYIDKKLGA